MVGASLIALALVKSYNSYMVYYGFHSYNMIGNIMEASEILNNANLGNTEWGKRIITAELASEFTPDDIYLATQWTTCACGTADKRIPRYKNEDGDFVKPHDDQLQTLGYLFNREVNYNNFIGAAGTLIAIEVRSSIILGRMRKNGGLDS